MRSGGMLRVMAFSSPLFASTLLLLLLAHANALPLQYLPEIPGYIPVYIRHGDQPLEEINPALAEAFHESSGILKNIRDDLNDRNDVSLHSNEENSSRENANPPMPPKQLIYDFPQEKSNFPPKDKPTEKESVVMKLAKTSPLDKIDIKKLTQEIKEKKENK
ncbi:uncharacterized protein LOC100122515 [Nasonia vitripennis]|uniref:Uncharacterized protein n=1 Tax=Nasonia vitripennis TaxID=7425 RepID=A0A7M7GCD8_NASVI|nr:uncharacterized protein LOC100122515 [Nasonia vitripennis]